MYATYCISVHGMALLVCLYFNCPLELSLVYHKLAVSTGKIHDEKQGHLSSLSALCLEESDRLMLRMRERLEEYYSKIQTFQKDHDSNFNHRGKEEECRV